MDFLPKSSIFLENICPFEKICPKVPFPQRISALSVYLSKCFVFLQNICPIGLSDQYQIICLRFKNPPCSAVAATAAAAENQKNVKPPFNPCLYSPNHIIISLFYIFSYASLLGVTFCCSSSSWMEKSAQNLLFLTEENLPFKRICPKVLFPYKRKSALSKSALSKSAQKLYFLTRENLPSLFQGICPFKESAQMMIFGEGRFLLVKKNNFCADPS